MPQVNIPNIGLVNFPDSMSHDEITSAIQNNILKQTAPVSKPEQEGPIRVDENAPDFTRALENAIPQYQQMYGAAKVLTGKALGSDPLMQSGLESMKAGEAKTKVKETDEFTGAWEKGIGAVITDWLPYQAGAGVASILETLGMMGIGAGVGALSGAGIGALPGALAGAVSKSLIKKGVQDAAANVLENIAKKEIAAGATKEAAKITAEKAAADFVAKNTVKELSEMQAKVYSRNASKSIGANLGLASEAGLHGMGEVTQQAIQANEERGQNPTDIDLQRVIPAAIVHGVADFFTEKIGLNALKGMSGEASKSMIYDIAKTIAVTGTKESVPELIQTAAQRYGANLSLKDAEALKDYVNTIAASYGMSVVPGGIGGVRTHLSGRIPESSNNEIKKSIEETKQAAQTIEPAIQDPLLQSTVDAQGNPIGTSIENAVSQETTEATTTPIEEKEEAPVTPIEEKEEAPVTPIEEKKAVNAANPIQAAQSFINNLKDIKQTNKNELVKIADSIGLKLPPVISNVGRVEKIKEHLAKQGEQNAIQQINASTSGAGAEVSGGPIPSGTAERVTGAGQPGVGGAGNISQQSQVGASAQQPALIRKTPTRIRKTPTRPLPLKEEFPSISPIEMQRGLEKQQAEADQAEKDRQAALQEVAGKNIPQTKTEENIREEYELSRQALSTDEETVPAWNDLSSDERDNFLGNLKTSQSAEDFDNAVKALMKYKEDKNDSLESLPPQKQKVANGYDENKNIYSRRLGIDMPAWFNLSPEAQGIYLDNVKNNTVIEQDAGFNAVAGQLEQEGKGIRGINKSQIERIKLKGTEQESLTKAQEQIAKDIADKAQAVGKDKKLTKANKLQEEIDQEEKKLADEVAAAQEKIAPKRQATKVKEPINKKLDEDVTNSIVSNNLENAIRSISEKSDRAVRDMADTFIKLINDFGNITIKFGEVKNGDGQFDPSNNTITIKGENEVYTGERPLTEAVMHETGHYLLDHVLDNPKEYVASLPANERAAAQAAINRLRNNYNYAKSKLGKKYNIGTIKEFAAEFFGNNKFQIDLATIDLEKEGIKPEVGPIKTYKPIEIKKGRTKENLLSRIIDNIVKVFIPRPYEGVIYKEVLEDLGRILSLPTAELKGKEISYSTTKQAPDLRDDGNIIVENDKPVESISSENQPKNIKYFKKLLFTRPGLRRVVKAFQNDRYEIKHWQDVLDMAGKIYYEGKDKINNIYGQLTLATGRAKNLYNSKIEGIYNNLDKAVYDLSKATGLDIAHSLDTLHRILEGLHEKERREVKYLMLVPLSKKPTLSQNGKLISPADRRAQIFKLLDTKKLTEAQAKSLRNELNAIVYAKNPQGDFKYIDKFGDSARQAVDKNGKLLGVNTDFNSDDYNVTGLTRAAADERVKQYNESEHKDLFDKVIKNIKELHNVTTELNQMANYWSDPVSNRVAFYGFENYIPLEGIQKPTEADEFLDFDSKRMGKEMQEMAYSFEGRISVSNNSVLQSMTNAVRAAMRAGRKDLTQSIKNSVAKGEHNKEGQGILQGKIIAHISFEDRRNKEITDALPREKTIFHYNEDGSIDVIEITSDKLREAIRRTYKNTSPFTDIANNITSKLGMSHTRYNYNFAPLNFVRDALTNAWTIGAEMGPTEAAKLISQLSTKVLQGGLPKAMKIAALYESKNFDQINALVKKDPIIKDMVDFITEGGMVEYIQGISLKSNFQRLQKEIGRSAIMRNVSQFNKFVDIWTDMFELASRSAAYAIAKNNYMEKEGLSEKAASTKAAAFAKNLANFEQVGDYGKVLGGIFMFFRPSATGAVRAIEAAAPAFQNINSVMQSLPKELSEKERETFKTNFKERQKNARYMLTTLMGAGALIYTMSMMMSGDDDLDRNKVINDNPEQWTRFARFFTPFSDSPIQMPWGFGLGSFAAAGAQLAMVVSGHQSFGGALGNILTQISLDSFIPIPVSRMNISDNPALWMLDSLTPSALRPAMEFVVNKNGLGQSIYNDSNRRMGDAYIGGDNVPQIYKDISRWLVDSTDGDLDWSPNSIYFLSNSYMDGPARIVEGLVNGMYLASGTAEEKDVIARAKGAPLVGSFIGAAPNVDSREFTSIEKQIQNKEKIIKMFESNPEQLGKYLVKNPMDEEIVDFYNEQVNNRLKDLRHEAKQIRLQQDLTPRDRAEIIKAINVEQNLVKYELVQQFRAYGLKP